MERAKRQKTTKETDERPKRIDIHTHILPEDIPNFRQRYGYGDFIRLEHHCSNKAKMFKGDKFFREVEENCYRVEPRLEECDEHGVTVQVLSTVPVMFSYWAQPEDCLELSMMLNDHIVGICKKHPKRFLGLATLPMHEPTLAVKELERIMGEPSMRGVQIASHINDLPLSDPKFFPIFQAAERLNAVVFVHPWDMAGEKLMNKYWLPWLVGMPAETSFAICSFIFGGIFERLPNLKVCFAHGGGSFPHTLGRIEHGFKCRPDLVAVDNPHNPREYMGKFWVDSLVHDPEALMSIAKIFGTDKILMGSDYPFPLGEIPTPLTPQEYPGRCIEESTLALKEKLNMLWFNGLKFLGVKPEQFDDDAEEEEGKDGKEEKVNGKEEKGNGKEEKGNGKEKEKEKEERFMNGDQRKPHQMIQRE